MQIEIKALSPLHLGSGKADVVLDAEVVHDKYGLPYFPAKRLKGLLYESALEMAEISQEQWFTIDDINLLFGHNDKAITQLVISNFYLPNYDKIYANWQYLTQKYPSLFTKEAILNAYTSIRYQTSIDKQTGTTVDGSLHNMRVVDKDIAFIGEIKLLEDTELNNKILEFALKNLRFAGAKRNRGCGKIECNIIPANGKIRYRTFQENQSTSSKIYNPTNELQNKQIDKLAAKDKYKNKQSFGKAKHKTKKKRR